MPSKKSLSNEEIVVQESMHRNLTVKDWPVQICRECKKRRKCRHYDRWFGEPDCWVCWGCEAYGQ